MYVCYLINILNMTSVFFLLQLYDNWMCVNTLSLTTDRFIYAIPARLSK